MPLLPCHIGSSLFVQDVPKLLWQTDIRYISRITEQRSDLPGVPAGVATTYACDQEICLALDFFDASPEAFALILRIK